MSNIIGLGGKLSAGKTVTVISLLLDDFSKGKKIISNIELFNIPYRHMPSENFVDFIIKNRNNQSLMQESFYNSSILIDEARGLFSARRSMSNLAEIVTSWIMMCGKLDIKFYYTFQVWNSQIDLQLREMTDTILKCTRCNNLGIPITSENRILTEDILIKVEILKPTEKAVINTGKYYFYNPKNYYSFYKTREIIIVDRNKYLRKN